MVLLENMRFVVEPHSHIADTKFCQFLKLNNDIMRYKTVNSEIFMRTLFSRSFVKIKPSRNGKITLSFIDIGKSSLSRKFFKSPICLLMPFAKIKFSQNFRIYSKLAERVTEGTSVPFEVCMLPFIYPHYLCGLFYF